MEYGEEEAKWREGRRRKATGEELSEGEKKKVRQEPKWKAATEKFVYSDFTGRKKK